MKTLEKLVASVAVAGLLFGGAGPALADGGGDREKDKDKDKRHSRYDERKNGEVDVVVNYRHKGHWRTKTFEDKSLERAASIAKEKCHGGDWREYYRDARKVDRTGKTDKVCNKRYVKVYFEQDEDKDRHWDKDNGKDKGKGRDK
ncbi:hypothetical protein [uncultured Kocuria sp.]|uniref:hypothetical protein n=1 Tax=uncultured Kocuria sp. TaxID=259305 RepID=UPI0026245265|nr:hypothetical protein [uncultured Kocuria sp.]